MCCAMCCLLQWFKLPWNTMQEMELTEDLELDILCGNHLSPPSLSFAAVASSRVITPPRPGPARSGVFRLPDGGAVFAQFWKGPGHRDV